MARGEKKQPVNPRHLQLNSVAAYLVLNGPFESVRDAVRAAMDRLKIEANPGVGNPYRKAVRKQKGGFGATGNTKSIVQWCNTAVAEDAEKLQVLNDLSP